PSGLGTSRSTFGRWLRSKLLSRFEPLIAPDPAHRRPADPRNKIHAPPAAKNPAVERVVLNALRGVAPGFDFRPSGLGTSRSTFGRWLRSKFPSRFELLIA